MGPLAGHGRVKGKYRQSWGGGCWEKMRGVEEGGLKNAWGWEQEAGRRDGADSMRRFGGETGTDSGTTAE